MKKKILILSLTLGYGGIEKYISSLCKMFKENYEVKIICNYKELDKPAFNYYDAKIEYIFDHKFRLESIKDLLVNGKIFKIANEIISRAKMKLLETKLIKKKIKQEKYDVIITTRLNHNKIVNKYLKRDDVLKIATEHNSYDIELGYDKKICKSVSNFNYLVLVSKQQKKHYDELFDRCIYIPNVMDEISNKVSKLNSLNLISVGRLSKEKGFLDLIRVIDLLVKRNSKIKLYLAGDGYQKQEIINLINELKLNDSVVMLGYKTQEELKKYYLDSSLYVMTSYSEAFGIVLLEAMNYGVVCVAFDSAKGACEVLKDSGGVLIKDRNINKMANKILELLNDKQRLLELQEKSKEHVKNYDIKKVKEQWIKLIENK